MGKNWKIFENLQKNEKVVSKKQETTFWINFQHISAEISCNFQRNFKKLEESFRENSISFYRHFGEFVVSFSKIFREKLKYFEINVDDIIKVF